jgi:hypothetical protein
MSVVSPTGPPQYPDKMDNDEKVSVDSNVNESGISERDIEFERKTLYETPNAID